MRYVPQPSPLNRPIEEWQSLDHLDAAIAGDTKSVDSLTQLIAALPRGLKRGPPTRPPPPLPPDPSKNRLACLPPGKALLDVRPYAKVSGPRHVPILASANGIPFLRITKPQPPALTRIIQQKLKNRNKRFDERTLINNYWTPIGRYEDEWDARLEERFGLREEATTAASEPKWVDEFILASQANANRYEKETAKDREYARKMLRLVDEETRLAMREGQEVVRGRKGKPIQSHWPT